MSVIMLCIISGQILLARLKFLTIADHLFSKPEIYFVFNIGMCAFVHPKHIHVNGSSMSP